MSTKTIFISYSHDSDDHAERVLSLSERLRDDGIDTRLDQYVNGTPSGGWPRWMLNQLDEADSVIVICSETYYRRFRGREEPGRGKGADWEGALITQEMYDARSNTLKFVPVVFNAEQIPFIPEPLRALTHYVLKSEEEYERLYDFLMGQAGVEPRPIGAGKTKERRRGVPLEFERLRLSEESQPRIAPLRLSVTGKKFVGRENELDMLDSAWNSSGDGKINVVSLIGQGGEGKTALVLNWYSRRARNGWQGARRVFDWSFYSQGTSAQTATSADEFFNAAFEWFGYSGEIPKDPWMKGGKLAELIASERTLLILDGLEPLQQPPGEYGGEFKDPAMKALLRRLAVQNPGLCVLTSRTDISDLADFEHANGTCLRHPVHELDLATARQLLGGLGVIGPDRELDEAITWFHGHAYDLNLLGNYLAKCTPDHDIRGWQERFPLLQEDERIHPKHDAAGRRAGHGVRMLRAYERWLGKDSPQVAILRLLGLFDRPARSDLLDELRAKPTVKGLTDALVDLPDDEWLRNLDQLQQLSLITREQVSVPPTVASAPDRIGPSTDEIPDELVAIFLQREEVPEEMKKLPKTELKQLIADALADLHKGKEALRPRRPLSYVVDTHPLLREHFGAELRETQPKGWLEGHRRLYQYLCETTPDKPEPTLEDLQPLYQAVAHGCHAGLHQEACDNVYNDRILRSAEQYSYYKLGVFGSDLGIIACFFESPWTRISSALTKDFQAWLMNQAAFCLRALGRLTEALEPLRAGLKMRIKQEAWTSAAIVANNLSELELTLGEIDGALRDAQQCVSFADRSGDFHMCQESRATHAHALHQRGRVGDSLVGFVQAEEMQTKGQPEIPFLYSIRGFKYCDLLLSASERAAWQTMLQLGTQKSELTVTDSCGSVSERASQMIKIAEKNSWLLDIGLDHLTLGRAALYQAILASPHSNLRVPGYELDAAVKGLRRAGEQIWLTAGLISRAWLWRLSGGADGARADLDEAWEIAERGPMRLFMADIHLYRARLFGGKAEGGGMKDEGGKLKYPWDKNPDGSPRGPKDDLAAARKLIEQCGYWRRKEELEDAEEAAKNW